MTIRVLRSYRYLTKPGRQIGFGDVVIKGLTDHAADFPAPDVDVLTLTGINDSYRVFIAEAETGDEVKIISRNKYYRETWLPAFDKNAAYVERIANGRAYLILGAGFKPSKEMKGKKKLHEDVPAQMILQVNSEGRGHLNYKSTTKVNARNFLLIGRIADDSTLQQNNNHVAIDGKNQGVHIIPVTRKKGTVSGLPAETKMTWQIMAINRSGASLLSQAVTVMIQ